MNRDQFIRKTSYTIIDEYIAKNKKLERDLFGLGLGDVVEKIADPVKNIVNKYFPSFLKGCNCSGRKKFLNKTIPLSRGAKREIHSWAVGVTTAPRPNEQNYLRKTITSLVKAGWYDINIFAEPDSIIDMEIKKKFNVVYNESKLGSWQNYFNSWKYLRENFPNVDCYFVSQDDVVYPEALRFWADQAFWPKNDFGCVSFYHSERFDEDHGVEVAHQDYWGKYLNRGLGFWGALSICFPPDKLDNFLENKKIHTLSGNRLDQRVGMWCRSQNLPLYVCSPSLSQHIGIISSIGHATSGKGMKASDFVGEGYNMVYNM